jgi:general secretion pathway protein N
MKFLLRLLIALGTVLLVAGVVAWKAPSDWFAKRAAEPRYDIRYSGTSGTMWDGKALDVRWHERSLGGVDWNFMTLGQFYPTFTTWQLEGKGEDYQLSALADFEGESLQRLRYINGELPAAWVDVSEHVPLLQLGGRLEINLDFLNPGRGARELTEGTIQWSNASLAGLLEERLGDIAINIEASDGTTRATFNSSQVRNIMIEGEVSLRAGHYEVLLIVHATDKKRYVIEQLASLGEIHADGSLYITRSGRIQR